MNTSSALSIQTRINTLLMLLMVAILSGSLLLIYKSEMDLTRTIAENSTQARADSYFDSLNLLMLSGGMQNSELLRQKILSDPSIVEARIVRGPQVVKLYGAGDASSASRDELDRRALSGEDILQETFDDNGHRLTVLLPMKASSDHKGTNCLGCHQAKEGEVLGAVRLTYDFAVLDKHTRDNILTLALMELGLLIIGLLITAWRLRAVIIRPINSLVKTMQAVEEHNDLSCRAELMRNDEIGHMARALNSMLETFRQNLQQVRETIVHLAANSDRLDGIAETTASSAKAQQQQINSVASSMDQMKASTHQVQQHADSIVSASDMALAESSEAIRITRNATDAIDSLKATVDQAAGVIATLTAQSEEVGKILDVIQKIADQTNLLALNASIESARAGDNGRGFSVVADEVRVLSKRTHEATTNISTIISELRSDASDAAEVMTRSLSRAEEGVNSIDRTDQALHNITDGIESINSMNHEIADTIHEQRRMAISVDEHINDISSDSQQTAERARDLSELASDLNQLSAQLEAMIRRFTL